MTDLKVGGKYKKLAIVITFVKCEIEWFNQPWNLWNSMTDFDQPQNVEGEMGEDNVRDYFYVFYLQIEFKIILLPPNS